MDAVIYSFELIWLSQFWSPSYIQSDFAFHNQLCGKLLEIKDIIMRPVPPRRHCKNPLEPRHGTIRSIFLRLKSADTTTSDAIQAIRAVRISNDLYGSDTV